MKLINKIMWTLQKRKTSILMGTGAVMLVAGGYKLSTAVTRVKSSKEKLKETREAIGEEDTPENKAAKTTMYRSFIFDTAKAVTPAVVLLAGGVTCLVWSDKEWRKRMASVTAYAESLDISFKGYRKYITDKYGADVDRAALLNQSEVEITELDGKKTKKHKEKVNDDKAIDINPYVFVFKEGTSSEWRKSNTFNRMFIEGQRIAANDLLRVKNTGVLFLNEVLELLGMEPTKAGNIVGWYYDPHDDSRDNIVDFGIDIDILNMYEKDEWPELVLEFNCDGNVLEKLPETQKGGD